MPIRVKVGDQILDAPDNLSDANLLLWVKSNAPMQEPTTFSGGFHKQLKDEPVAGGAVGFVEGLPAGVGEGFKGLVMLPVSILKGIVSTVEDAKDPAAALEKYAKAWGDKPGEIRDTLNHYVELARRDPEGFGKAIGELTGNVEAGIATSAAVPLAPKSLARTIGPKLETLGKRAEFPLMLSGAHELASGNVLQGVGTMMAPSAIKGTGKAIREFGGLRIHPDEAAKLEGKFNDAMTNRNVSFADEQAKAAKKVPMPSGARDIDIQPTGATIRLAPSTAPATERVPKTGGPNVTTRPSAKATIKEEADAEIAKTRQEEIDAAKKGLVEGKPTVTRTVRQGNESKTTRFTPPEKTPDELVEEQLAALKARADKIAPRSGPVRMAPPQPVKAAPLPAEQVNTMGAKAAEMGDKAVSDMKAAGMAVPEKGGISSTRDIDKLVSGPQPPPSGAIRIQGQPNLPRTPMSAVPDEYIDSVVKLVGRTKSKNRSWLATDFSPDDIATVVEGHRRGFSPEETAVAVKTHRANRHQIHYTDAVINKQMKSQFEHEPE